MTAVVPDSTTELIEANLPLVGHLVREALQRVPGHVHVDDLTSAATTALVLAARNFEPERGVPFGAYARVCIRGALIDELRSMDWASRRVRREARSIQAVSDQLTGALGRTPTVTELSQATGLSATEIEDVRRDADRAHVLSLDSIEGAAEPATPSHTDPETLILYRERVGYLHHAVAALPERLRLVIVAYFFEQRPQQEIAEELGVTPSRVSQLQAEALRLLHAGLGGELGTDTPAPRTGSSSARSAAAAARFAASVSAGSTVATRLAVTTPLGETQARIA
jgi:RNA polymerase sigma factor for flagellar operon FliA